MEAQRAAVQGAVSSRHSAIQRLRRFEGDIAPWETWPPSGAWEAYLLEQVRADVLGPDSPFFDPWAFFGRKAAAAAAKLAANAAKPAAAKPLRASADAPPWQFRVWDVRHGRNGPDADYPRELLRVWGWPPGAADASDDIIPYELTALRFADGTELRWDMRLDPRWSGGALRLRRADGTLARVDAARLGAKLFTVPRTLRFGMETVEPGDGRREVQVAGSLLDVLAALHTEFLRYLGADLYAEYARLAAVAGLTPAEFERRWQARRRWPGWLTVRPKYVYAGLWRGVDDVLARSRRFAVMDTGDFGQPCLLDAEWCGTTESSAAAARRRYFFDTR